MGLTRLDLLTFHDDHFAKYQGGPRQEQGIEPWRSKAPHLGTITIGRRTYNHDVVIRLSGAIVNRGKTQGIKCTTN